MTAKVDRARRGLAACMLAVPLALLAAPAAGQVATPPETSASAASAPARLPFRQVGDDAGPLSAMGPLLAVMGIAAIGLWFWLNLRGRGMNASVPLARWGGMGAGKGRVVVLERTSLTPTSAIVLVRWDDTELLVATSAQSVTVLSERKVPAAAPAAPGEAPCA